MLRIPAILAALWIALTAAHAQSSSPTPSESYVDGKVCMFLNGSSQAIFCSAANPLPVTVISGGGGGGGAVTLASGAVASGAYSAGSIASGAYSAGSISAGAVVSGAYLAGALADGAITTMGTEADSAWTSGNATLIALGKATVNAINGPVSANVGSTTTPLNAKTVGGTTGLAVGINDIGGTALVFGQAVAASSIPVVLPSATNVPVNPGTAANWGLGATGAAPPANAEQLGTTQSGATGGFLRGVIQCDNHVFKHITSATDTLAVQGVASQTIYICGWRSRAAGVATWFLENTASTNANCSSANTQITGVATEAANTGEVAKSAFWDGLKNTSANGLCINSTGTGGVDIDIWYTQF